MVDYITNKDTIIFSPNYNVLTDVNLLSLYNKIIFSNYELNEELFEKYENLDFEYLKWIGSKFNQKVELPENLTHLTFGENFNQKVELPVNLSHLTFGDCFNQKVDLPSNLTHLTFGSDFNQKVELPFDIKYLKLENDESHNLDYLPEGIEEIELGEYFQDETLCNLPNSLKVQKYMNIIKVI